MYDYAHVHLLGRVIENAQIVLNDEGKPSKAFLTIVCNISFKRKDELDIRTIYRKVLVLGSLAKYVKDCQSGDSEGLKGRLVHVVGMMDNELGGDRQEIILVSHADGGFLKIIDRRQNSNE